MHYSNPSPFIPGVEIIPHEGTDPAIIPVVESIVHSTGKETALVKDQTGFVLNRLQYALFIEANRILAEGVASAEDIDTIVRTTFGFRLPFFGPFAIADMAGLDVYRMGLESVQGAYPGRFETPAALDDLVAAGKFGTKTGAGYLELPRRADPRAGGVPQPRVRRDVQAAGGARAAADQLVQVEPAVDVEGLAGDEPRVGESRNAIAFATSSGTPTRPTNSRAPSSDLRSSLRVPTKSVSIGPGAIALAVIPTGPSSRARDRMRPLSAAFDTEYGVFVLVPPPSCADVEDSVTIRPTPCCAIVRATRWVT